MAQSSTSVLISAITLLWALPSAALSRKCGMLMTQVALVRSSLKMRNQPSHSVFPRNVCHLKSMSLPMLTSLSQLSSGNHIVIKPSYNMGIIDLHRWVPPKMVCALKFHSSLPTLISLSRKSSPTQLAGFLALSRLAGFPELF